MKRRAIPVDIIAVLGAKDLSRCLSTGKKQGYRVTIKKVGKVGRYNEYIVTYWPKKAG